MKLIDVKKLLDDNGYTYTQTIVPSRAEFYRQKGFNPSEDTGAFILLSIPNPVAIGMNCLIVKKSMLHMSYLPKSREL